MNILIVDDEVYIAKWIEDSVKWAEIGIEKVFIAFSFGQSRQIFQQNQIDILLADIEMPKGSGFDLLNWANQEGFYPVTLFLTSYSKFEYAQKAIGMQCLNYIVKPADVERLTHELHAAVETVQKNEALCQCQRLADCWNSRLNTRAETFWRGVYSENLPADEKSLAKIITREQLPQEILSCEYYYILVQFELDKRNCLWAKDLINFVIRNIVSELLEQDESYPFPDMDENHFMLSCSRAQFSSDDKILSACLNAAHKCQELLPGKLTLFLAGPAQVTEAANCYKLLRKTESELFSTASAALLISDLTDLRNSKNVDISAEDWSEALLTNNAQSLVDQIGRVFSPEQIFYHRSLLNDLYYGVLQAIILAFEKKGISSRDVFNDDEIQPSSADATKSLDEFWRWINYIIPKVRKELNKVAVSGSVIESVHQYILSHLFDEKLNRIQIASSIHLNPDYLSSLFKEKTGQSLCAFITAERVKVSKRMLLSTTLPISIISLQIGFNDISYFSKQFKSIVGMSPQQYRKQASQE